MYKYCVENHWIVRRLTLKNIDVNQTLFNFTESMKRHFILILLLSAVFLSSAQSYDAWDAQLKKYVSNSGEVNYKAWKSEEAKLEEILRSFSSNAPSSNASTKEQIAFWANVYNAFTVKTILENYPVKSIMDLEGGKVWDKATIKVGGEEYTLNMIEHEVIRKKYFDSRIHFILNCAAQSCPKLHNAAFQASSLEEVMEKLSTEFINNSSKNSISTNSVEVSQLFNWYKGDFTKSTSLIEYLNQYSKTKANSNAKVSFKEYDWSLNSSSQ